MKKWETPFTFPNGLTVKNRLVFAPISTMTSSAIGQLSPEEIKFYESRSHEAGLVVLGSANISLAGKAYQNNVSIAHEAVVPNLRKYNNTIKVSGAKSIIQIYHGGDSVVSQASEKDLLVIVEDFGKAIRRAIRSGFDGIEIHAGNPFLLQQFLSPLLNERDDEWGGNGARRFRLLEIILKVACELSKEATTPFAIGVRLAMEGQDVSFAETRRIVERLSSLPIDYIHFNQHSVFEKDKIDLIETPIPIMGNGGVKNEDGLETALLMAPIISVARPIILNPTFPKKVEDYQSLSEIRPKDLLIPKGLWKSIVDSPDWYLNNN